MSNQPLPSLPSVEFQTAVQAARDADHLRLLEIGFYISGVLTALRFLWFGIIGLFFAFGGVAAIIAAAKNHESSQNAPPPAVLAIFAVIFVVVIFLTLVFAALEFYAGMCLKKRKHPVLIQVVAAFYCISIPWGTAIGVFTFMVLNRESVKAIFARNALAPAPVTASLGSTAR